MNDKEIDDAICEISREEDPDDNCRYRNVLSDREALQNATWAIVETLRQLRDSLKTDDKETP